MEEIWKDIVGYEGYYQVSNLGRVKSLERKVYYKTKTNEIKYKSVDEQILKGKVGNSGYLRVHFRIGKNNNNKSIHRLVALAFIPNPLNKPQINHINGIKTDNRVENLEWCNACENMQHAWKHHLIKNIENMLIGGEKGREKRYRPIILLKNNIVVKDFKNKISACRFFNIDHKTIERKIERQEEIQGYIVKYK